MAVSWISSEATGASEGITNNAEKTPPNFLSEIINNTSNNGSAWSANSIQNAFTKTNHLLQLPEQDVDKISPTVVQDVEFADEEEDCNVFHSGLITKAFLPMRIVSIIVGRWPFQLKMKGVRRSKTCWRRRHDSDEDTGHHHQHHRRSVRVNFYDSSFKSPLWIYFGLTTFFILVVLTVSTLSFFDVFLEWKLFSGEKWGVLTKETFKKNLVMFLLVWGCLLHSTLSSFSLLRNRKHVVNFLNYWNCAADELLMTEAKAHRNFLIASNVGYLVFLVLIYFAYSWLKYVN